jgi:hypothetical protein
MYKFLTQAIDTLLLTKINKHTVLYEFNSYASEVHNEPSLSELR